MEEIFIGTIRIFPFGYAPNGWALCNGQTMQVAQNQALFSLISNHFGGDGKTTFALPNLTGAGPDALTIHDQNQEGYCQYYIATQGYYPSRD